jgi:hypothetical protein
MPKVPSDLGWGGVGLQQLNELLVAVADDLNTLKAAIDELQSLTPGAEQATGLTLEK